MELWMWAVVYASYGAYTAGLVFTREWQEPGPEHRDAGVLAVVAFGWWPLFLPWALTRRGP